MRFLNIAGDRFGRLVAVRLDEEKSQGVGIWECRCDCGKTVFAICGQLRIGTIKSCGCSRRTHGHTIGGKPTPTFKSWESMRQRCENSNDPSFEHYGGRGISVCKRWMRFKKFLADMGERPHGTTLDRIDNNGNYEPKNCRWATAEQQKANRRTTRRYTANGVTKTIQEWATDLGVTPQAIHKRIRKGMAAELAVTTSITPARAKQKGL